jgi:hypothetical protein
MADDEVLQQHQEFFWQLGDATTLIITTTAPAQRPARVQLVSTDLNQMAQPILSICFVEARARQETARADRHPGCAG